MFDWAVLLYGEIKHWSLFGVNEIIAWYWPTGHLNSTEKIYKYHMQVQEEEEEEPIPVTPTKSSPKVTPTEDTPSATDWIR